MKNVDRQTIETRIESYDSRMRAIVDSASLIERIDSSAGHSEGPVYVPSDESVVWSDVSGSRVLRWQAGEVSVLREHSCYQNGNALDLEGRIVACSHGNRAIVRQEHSGEWQILVDRYQGRRLNSPNDIVVKSDGTLWFTDPPFGLTQKLEGCGGEQEQLGSFVYRFDPATGEIDAVVTDMTRPNGLAFSPNEALLYVSDTSAYEDPELYHDIRVYEIVEERRAMMGRVFTVVNPGQPDGICVDYQGNVFSSSADSVQVFTANGCYLGKILFPEVCANVTFGGAKHNRLFVTAGASLYAIDLKTHGVPTNFFKQLQQWKAHHHFPQPPPAIEGFSSQSPSCLLENAIYGN